MAYNGGFPASYAPYYQQQVMPQQMMSQQQVIPQQQTQQIQNGGFMLVANEDIARSYPVAPGNCVTFKIEGKPIVMEKSMGFSQLEAPRVDRYRLVREEDAPPENNTPATQNPEWKEEIKKMWGEIDVLKRQVEKLSELAKREEDSGA